jgi:hypothetical protein
MKIEDKVITRFKELESDIQNVKTNTASIAGISPSWVESTSWEKWISSVINLIKIAFGNDSIHFDNINTLYIESKRSISDFDRAKGIFLSAKEDYEKGFFMSLEKQIAGELFGSLVNLAKYAITENQKEVAAVLACASLEDILKKYANIHGLEVENKDLTEVINSLKSKGLVQGTQKTLLDTMPKIRNYAMHAEWTKINIEDVSSIIGFVEQFLISRF